jgi:diguanylate cyclase (GGDEF)-like protein/PAS domain S-box-containing protein
MGSAGTSFTGSADATLGIRDAFCSLPGIVPHTGSVTLALDALPVGISGTSLENQSILFMNRCFLKTFGYALDDFTGVHDWIGKTHPFEEDRALAAETWRACITATQQQSSLDPIEVRILCKDGSIKTVLNNSVILPQAGWALSTFVDITQRREDQRLLEEADRKARENESIYRLLLDHSPGVIILAPFDKSKRYISPSVEHLTGFTAQEYLAMKHPGMIHPDDQLAAKQVVTGIRSGNLSQVFRYRTLQKTGGYRWVEAMINGYLDPVSQQAAGYIATVRDISEQKIREETLAYENRQLSAVASLDELTGIANRRTFNQRLEVESLRQDKSAGCLSLLMLDVDYFKQFNDIYGHLPGDECLKKIAQALKRCLRRGGDLAARFGGEEFVAILPLTDGLGAEVAAKAIMRAIGALNVVHAGSPHGMVTISIGIATWPANTPLHQVDDLLERADRALYQAKRGGRNQCHVLETNLGRT